MIGILVAVREELKPILKRMPSVTQVVAGGFTFWHGTLGGKPVVLVKSGMGAERAANAARALTQHTPLETVIVAGFCGGLHAGARPGLIVIPNRTERLADGLDRLTGCAGDRPTQPLVDLASQCAAPATVGGSLVTLSAPATVNDKKRLATDDRNRVAVDMESAGAARALTDAGVSFLVVRAITDGPDDDLPLDFSRLASDSTGEVSIPRLAAYLALRPSKAAGVIRLGRRASVAARNLTKFVESYIAAM